MSLEIQKIKRLDYEDWIDSPVTKALMELIREHRQASYLMVTEQMINEPSLKDIDMCMVAQFRGQVQTFDRLLDINEFLEERLELPKTEVTK